MKQLALTLLLLGSLQSAAVAQLAKVLTPAQIASASDLLPACKGITVSLAWDQDQVQANALATSLQQALSNATGITPMSGPEIDSGMPVPVGIEIRQETDAHACADNLARWLRRQRIMAFLDRSAPLVRRALGKHQIEIRIGTLPWQP